MLGLGREGRTPGPKLLISFQVDEELWQLVKQAAKLRGRWGETARFMRSLLVDFVQQVGEGERNEPERI